uniref:Endothelin-like toxin domain-containing protein n=1 Tax=Nothobranchius furzeri TaxID=105023 RepID=A0A8C6KM48_NOTFU
LPAAVMGPVAEEGPLAQLHHTAHRRDKRCSCENQKDKECIFFCHIGIVWVNSPRGRDDVIGRCFMGVSISFSQEPGSGS